MSESDSIARAGHYSLWLGQGPRSAQGENIEGREVNQMSSYFDRMARCMEDKYELMRLVRDQYRAKLSDANQRCLMADLDSLNEMIRRFGTLFSDKQISACSENQLPWLLQDMHTFAHDLGRKHIRLRGGAWVGDNPTIPY